MTTIRDGKTPVAVKVLERKPIDQVNEEFIIYHTKNGATVSRVESDEVQDIDD